MTHANSTPISELDRYIQLGMKMSVTFQFGPGDNYDFTTTLVGYKANQYVALDFPTKALEVLVMRKLSNIETVVRGICTKDFGHIVAFKTSTYQSIRRPFNMLFLRPPRHFASKTIREHERYKVNLPTAISTQEKDISGTMVDFSVSGAGIFVAGENELKLHDKVDLINCDLNSYLPQGLTGTIVKITRVAKGHLIGVKFDNTVEMSDELHNQVLEQAFHAGSI